MAMPTLRIACQWQHLGTEKDLIIVLMHPLTHLPSVKAETQKALLRLKLALLKWRPSLPYQLPHLHGLLTTTIM